MAEGPLTPLVSASSVPRQLRPVIEIPDRKLQLLEEYGTRRADGGAGNPENHQLGIFGEYAVARFLGIEDAVNTDVYPDGGDGGVDLVYRGKTIDVKAVGRGKRNPSLIVGQYTQFRSDYYALVIRTGTNRFELVGYCPHHFVRYAKMRHFNGKRVHQVPQEDLFPFPFWNRPMSARHADRYR